MAEAEEICDRIAIIHNGSIVTCETPQELKASLAKDTSVQIEVRNGSSKLNLKGMEGVIGSSFHDDNNGVTKIKVVLDDESRISDLVSMLTKEGCKIVSINTSEPSLEDVYIKYVGKDIASDEPAK
jgi:ABC-2 type transport system ATP-binding protein